MDSDLPMGFLIQLVELGWLVMMLLMGSSGLVAWSSWSLLLDVGGVDFPVASTTSTWGSRAAEILLFLTGRH